MNRTLILAAAVLVGGFSAGNGEGLSASAPADVTPGLADANQRWPAVAAGRDCYLVVWQEGEMIWGGDADICAARVSADGKPLDAGGFPVCKAAGFQAYPSVAFDGTGFVVAWSDYRNGTAAASGSAGQGWDVYAARVSPDGKVLDPDGFAVAAVPGNQAYAVVASDGRGSTLAAWSDVRPNPAKPETEVYALSGVLVRGGKPAEPAGHELGRARGSILAPAAAWDGSNYVVIAGAGGGGWRWSDPFAVAVSADGTAKPVKMDFGYTYSLAADPAGHRTLVWHNERREHGSYGCFYGSSMYTGLAAAGGARVLGYQWAFAPANEMWCAVAWDGRGFVGVVEQFEQGERNDSAPTRVELAATRLDAGSGKPLDVNFWDKPEKMPDAEFKKMNGERKPVVVASEPGVQLRHPAMASCGTGRSLLVYSRHGGVGKYKINAVLLGE
jgi:hypothetical protein